jgi:hypothetical protein
VFSRHLRQLPGTSVSAAGISEKSGLWFIFMPTQACFVNDLFWRASKSHYGQGPGKAGGFRAHQALKSPDQLVFGWLVLGLYVACAWLEGGFEVALVWL